MTLSRSRNVRMLQNGLVIRQSDAHYNSSSSTMSRAVCHFLFKVYMYNIPDFAKFNNMHHILGLLNTFWIKLETCFSLSRLTSVSAISIMLSFLMTSRNTKVYYLSSQSVILREASRKVVCLQERNVPCCLLVVNEPYLINILFGFLNLKQR